MVLDIVREKVEHVKREIRNTVIEGDRRRFSMLCEGIVSPRLYLGALSDFVYTIAKEGFHTNLYCLVFTRYSYKRRLF